MRSPLPFGTEAPSCYNEPDVIGALKRQHLGIAQTCSPRTLGGPSQEFGESGLVGVKLGEERLQSRRAHAPASRPAAKAALAVSSC